MKKTGKCEKGHKIWELSEENIINFWKKESRKNCWTRNKVEKMSQISQKMSHPSV